MNPASSQIAGHLNKVTIKIQSLSLFIGFGSDRQPERWCLFWFHNEQEMVGRKLKEMKGKLMSTYSVSDMTLKFLNVLSYLIFPATLGDGYYPLPFSR